MPRKNRTRKKNVSEKLSETPKAVKLRNLEYDPIIFETLTTGTVTDEFFSNKIGVPRACNFILIGDPGVGKTTVGLDMVCDLQQHGSKALFISAEMNDIDMYEYMERFPKFGDIDILFLGDYEDENPMLVIEAMLKKGYDIVLGDSFAEIMDEVKESCGLSTKAAEKWLIDLMVKHNKAGNDTGRYTTFIMIQQMTKGGKFVGSNKLKHNTTGMLEIRFDGNTESSPRYMEFSKNRRGKAGKRLYFMLNTPNDVNYLSDKWHAEEENRIRMEKELSELENESSIFDDLINSTEENTEDKSEKEIEIKETETVNN